MTDILRAALNPGGREGGRRAAGRALPGSSAGRSICLIVALCLAWTVPAYSVEPDEMLADPAQEARAQALDEDIRCVKCQSENIASSNADWARDARLVVRELIVEGRSDDQIMRFFVERYGERVLMNPRKDGANVVLWLAGPAMLVLALLIGAGYLRRRRVAEGPKPLSAEEQARLDEILKE